MPIVQWIFRVNLGITARWVICTNCLCLLSAATCDCLEPYFMVQIPAQLVLGFIVCCKRGGSSNAHTSCAHKCRLEARRHELEHTVGKQHCAGPELFALVILQILSLHNHMGGSLDPNSCFLVQRGIKTLPLRVRQASSNALALAEFLQQHPQARMLLLLCSYSHRLPAQSHIIDL